MPAHNEEEVIENTVNIVGEKIKYLIRKKKITSDSKLLVVDDGSKDNTFDILKK